MFIRMLSASGGTKEILLLLGGALFLFILSFLTTKILIAHSPERVKLKENAEAEEDRKIQKKKYDKKEKLIFALSLTGTAILLLTGHTCITILKGFCLMEILLFASLSDVQTRRIADSVSGALLLTGLIAASNKELFVNFVSAFLMFALMFVFAMIFFKKIGGADIKLMGAGTFVCGPVGGIAGTILGLLASIILTPVINRKKNKEDKKTLPLGPYLAFGYFCAYILTQIGMKSFILSLLSK